MNKLALMLRSRKFWAAIVGLAVVIVKAYHPDFPLDEARLTDFVTLIAAYILGTALEDMGARLG